MKKIDGIYKIIIIFFIILIIYTLMITLMKKELRLISNLPKVDTTFVVNDTSLYHVESTLIYNDIPYDSMDIDFIINSDSL